MREIKFRGRNYDGVWMYGYLIPTPKPQIHLDNKHCVCACPQVMSKVDKVHYEVEKNTIGQYTGLKDKNGKEIYEGDVLHIKQYENNGYRLFGTDVSFPNCFTLDECKGKLLRESNALVYFTEGCMCVGDMFISALFGDMRYSFPLFEFEIIGNIHDNPELIKEEEK